MAYLVVGKILRSTELNFELAESELSLLMKTKSCMSRNTVVRSFIYSAIKIIKDLR